MLQVSVKKFQVPDYDPSLIPWATSEPCAQKIINYQNILIICFEYSCKDITAPPLVAAVTTKIRRIIISVKQWQVQIR